MRDIDDWFDCMENYTSEYELKQTRNFINAVEYRMTHKPTGLFVEDSIGEIEADSYASFERFKKKLRDHLSDLVHKHKIKQRMEESYF